MYEEFKRVGRDLFVSGLITSHGGNMSVRVGDRIFITRRGSMLAHLEHKDIVETGLEEDDAGTELASRELVVHRAIYRLTSASAIVHAHPRYAIVLSLGRDEIVPIDSEGGYMLEKVPVVIARETIGSSEAARVVPPALQRHRVVMLRGHGSFAAGQSLEEAFQWTSVLEASSQILYLAQR